MLPKSPDSMACKALLGAAFALLALDASAQTAMAEYRFEDTAWNGTAGELIDSSGNGYSGRAVGTGLPTPLSATPARVTNTSGNGTCGYANFPGPVAIQGPNGSSTTLGGAFDVAGLPVTTTAGAQTTVTFWVYWKGNGNNMAVLGFNRYALYFNSTYMGFSTSNLVGATRDLYGIAETTSPAVTFVNTWRHVTAVFTHGGPITSNKIYVDSVSRFMSQRTGSPLVSAESVSSSLRIGGDPFTTANRFAGYIDDVRVYNGALTQTQINTIYASTHPCTTGSAGGFNAFETATAAASITGNIHTKVAGTPFGIDVVALNTAQNAVLTNFAGAVKVELLDASDNSGALDAYGCRSTWTAIAGNAGATLTFAAADAGRKSVATLSEPNAWPNVRVRMTTPATGAATRIGCSTDNFAIRPSAFASFSATDADWASAGTGRSLANVATAGGNVHKAGQPFTVRATAVNAAGTPATTTNYTGTPLATVTACAGAACSASPGSVSVTAAATAGVISTSATYSEAGSFALQLNDATFAAVDAADGSTALERTISSPVLPVGRFVPDHFDLTSLATPVLRTFGSASCASRSFTYLGQPFGYASVPQATVLARNASGATTANYTGSLWKLTGPSVTQTYTPTPSSPALDTSATTSPSLSSNNNGTGLVATSAGDSLKLTRPAAVLAPFNADLALTWAAQDASEAGVTGNGTISTTTPLTFSSMAFDAGAQMRFGVLHLTPAYGSELVDLPVQIDAQYWDGLRMATNTADQCTVLPASTTAMGNYQRGLAACNTAIAAAPAALTNGRTFLKLARPGSGHGGSVDLALQLGGSASGQTCTTAGGAAAAAAPASLAWLQGHGNGASTFDQNPSTRATFGLYRSPLVYRRENY